MEIDSSGLFYN